MEEADMMLWVGISFEQSASTSYFRKAREFLLRAGRWKHCTQAIINLSEEAHFNLLSACNNIGMPPAASLQFVFRPTSLSILTSGQIAPNASLSCAQQIWHPLL
jgi:hypothetical protein